MTVRILRLPGRLQPSQHILRTERQCFNPHAGGLEDRVSDRGHRRLSEGLLRSLCARGAARENLGRGNEYGHGRTEDISDEAWVDQKESRYDEHCGVPEPRSCDEIAVQTRGDDDDAGRCGQAAP